MNGFRNVDCGFRGTVERDFAPPPVLKAPALRNCTDKTVTQVFRFEQKYERNVTDKTGLTIGGKLSVNYVPNGGGTGGGGEFNIAFTKEQSHSTTWGSAQAVEFRADVDARRSGYVEWDPVFQIAKGWIYVKENGANSPSANAKFPISFLMAPDNIRDAARLTLQTERARC
ncbi:hypothetical protein CRH09_26820 [Nocardia terpenica]|uniref:Uncharacterized protein n=2 Tax=Nocardia terpenica TaxID=455432 RepID=A0A291RPL9_9NOCA|nr:hypothetical protein CRH09_26820 [Nocardia terpenica]